MDSRIKNDCPHSPKASKRWAHIGFILGPQQRVRRKQLLCIWINILENAGEVPGELITEVQANNLYLEISLETKSINLEAQKMAKLSFMYLKTCENMLKFNLKKWTVFFRKLKGRLPDSNRCLFFKPCDVKPRNQLRVVRCCIVGISRNWANEWQAVFSRRLLNDKVVPL